MCRPDRGPADRWELDPKDFDLLEDEPVPRLGHSREQQAQRRAAIVHQQNLIQDIRM